MRVKELITILQGANPESTVVIQKRHHKKKGQIQVSTPCVGIGYIWIGFDWDEGRVFLRPADIKI